MASEGYRVAVVGATGQVGTLMLQLLRERRFSASEIVPFASNRSAGRELGEGLVVRALNDDAVEGFDLAIFSAGGGTSGDWAPRFAAAGALVIDNSSRWRMHDDVPLVVSEVNPDALDVLADDGAHRGIVANPNCSTMQMVVALKPLYDAAGDDHTDEERKLMNETRKILGDSSIRISATCVRIPVVTGHSEAVNVQTRDPLAPDEARELLRQAPGVSVLDDPGAALYPHAITAAGSDDVFVGRVRRDPGNERALDLWIVSDNLRKGAATNAIQLAELLHERNLMHAQAATSAA